MPVRALLSLERALGLTEDAALGEVHDMVSMELENHDIKAMIFRPYMAMFEPRDDGLAGVRLPNWLLDRLWKALETHEAPLFARLQADIRGYSQSDPLPPVFGDVIEAGARRLRQQPETVLPEGYDAEDQAQMADFAAYLDIYATAREAVRRMPEWLGRLTAEKAVAIRIMFKDAGRLVEDGGLRWLEVVYANLDDGADIMAFVGIASDRASDRFLSQSELAVFGTRLLEAADMAQRRMVALMRTPEGLAEAAEMLLQALHLTQAMEDAIELTKDGVWGQAVARIRQSVAGQVEAQIGRVQEAIERAFPQTTVRHYGRVVGTVPVVEAPLEKTLAEALALCSFCNHIRSGAAQGGYVLRLTQALEGGEAYVSAYLEALLEVRSQADDGQKTVMAGQFEALIRLSEILCGPKKAQLARRRVASSAAQDMSKTVA